MKEAVLTDRNSGWRGWNIAPQVPFVTAGLIGLVGTLVFMMTVEER